MEARVRVIGRRKQKEGLGFSACVVLVTEECLKQKKNKKKKESAVFNSRSRLKLRFRSLLCLFDSLWFFRGIFLAV
ncbi:unnamed protein product [Sphenostylis stenocarpa]|uniref:Uncharacterized protein n=1 Tax=Sphenostylis stenocarpa TaxID=92480 RepID=A0AA86SUZ1_9FABA|nr:unnamed protein product [Sphenostylis stenocarpa]